MASSIGLKAGRPSAAAPAVSLSDLKAETTRLNVDIDRDLHKKLKLRAVHSGRSVADLVRELLIEALAESDE